MLDKLIDRVVDRVLARVEERRPKPQMHFNITNVADLERKMQQRRDDGQATA